MADVSKVGKRGTVVIPARLRRRYGIEEGSVVLVEEGPDCVVIRPAATVPVEVYSPERRAAFLLENATDAEDYARARDEVMGMGLDPDSIPHERPN
jgi:AbrB family looped-hinge helix DNA binding protein